MKRYQLRLFVAGRSARSERAIANLRRICQEDLGGDCDLSIIDVLEHPQEAENEKILATPTLIKSGPLPIRRFIGDLSVRERVLAGLEQQT
ncbi:MAG TPA: circadian clock KaiB family protein [Rhodothermales bacterium]|nr:circadian clock KaiB family protein [Rhodothermales bacterium]